MKSAASETRRRGAWSLMLRVGVTVGLLLLLLSTTALSPIAEVLATADVLLLALAVLVWSASTLFLAWRWQLMLEVDGGRFSRLSLLAVYAESHFFGLFLPSGVGGDAYRGLQVRRALGGLRRATVLLFSERLFGLWTASAFALCSLAAGPSRFGQASLLFVSALGLLALASFVAVSRAGSDFVQACLRLLGIKRFSAFHAAASEQLRAQVAAPVRVAKLVALSALQQTLAISCGWCCGLAAGVELPFSFYLMAMPIAWVTSLLPALGGVGPREAGLVLAMVTAGVNREAAIAAAALLLVAQIARGLLGGAIYLLRGRSLSIPAEEVSISGP